MYGITCNICGKKLTSDITYYSLGDCRHCTCKTCIKKYQELNNTTFKDALIKLSKPYKKTDINEDNGI